MSRRYYFLLGFLPVLPELGGRPGIAPEELRDCARSDGPAGEVVDAILLEQDLLGRESALAGEAEGGEGLVLADEQVRGEQPLPEFLAPEEGEARRIPADATWEAYYRHLGRVAARCRCRFLVDWVGFEVALRNALAAERARTLQLEPEDYRVAGDLAAPDDPAAEIVSAWAAAPDPLRALRVLDEARLAWTRQRSRHYSFRLDEVAAYARTLVLLTRWHRLESQAGDEAHRSG